MFKKLSQKIGFTQTEIKVILFLIVIFLIGFGYSELFKDDIKTEYKSFDYSEQDSLFKKYRDENSMIENIEYTKENIDIKSEVLEFESWDSNEKIELPPLQEKSINLNQADKNLLIRLPGIGEKTAEKIINLRNERGGYKTIEELLDVKGIGKSKLSKIEKFLYIK
jgi:competence ComEA-like helix-hairpin-helix protein